MEEQKYYDKNGEEIKAGYTIKHKDGDTEKVYACGDNNLGVNASNMNSPSWNGIQECYPLTEFDLSEWEIVERGKEINE